MRSRVRFIRLLLVCLAAFVFAGCVNVAGGGLALSIVTFMLLAFGLGVAACSDDKPLSNHGAAGWDVGEDARSGDAADTSELDANDDDAGNWEACCNNGVIDSCFCPAQMICNYGWFEDCGDGTCGDPMHGCLDRDAGSEDVFSGDDAEVEDDAVESDVADADGEDGVWESCCNDGVVDSCFCPAMMACNYGMYQDCGDGVCVSGGQECPVDGEGL